MRSLLAIGWVAAVLVTAGCGSSDEPEKKDERPAAKVDDTALGHYARTPKRVEDRVNASQDQYRDALKDRIEEDEGGAPKQEEPSGD